MRETLVQVRYGQTVVLATCTNNIPILTHFWPADLSILFIRVRPFVVLGFPGGCFHFNRVLHRTSCKRTVLPLIRRRVWRRLNWVCRASEPNWVCRASEPGLHGVWTGSARRLNWVRSVCIMLYKGSLVSKGLNVCSITKRWSRIKGPHCWARKRVAMHAAVRLQLDIW